MTCAWNELLMILPQWLRAEVAPLKNTPLQEIRMRLNSPPEFVLTDNSKWAKRITTESDLNFCINCASRYSPWSADTVSQGYITAQGGHRIGICGDAIIKDGIYSGVRSITSLCIRIARDYHGLCPQYTCRGHSVLILGAPGWGKTTLLRDITRTISEGETVSVVDERKEIFPAGFEYGKKMDVLSGCPKKQGIEILLKTMSPQVLAVDEITSVEDCFAVVQAFGCGVKLIATAHASGQADFQRRKIYNALREKQIFDRFLILHPDKSFHMEAV